MKTHTHRKARRENSVVAPEHPDPSASEGRAVASPTPQQAPSQRRVERLRDVAARTCRSRSSIWRDIRDGNFPIPVKLSESGSIGFFSDEIDAMDFESSACSPSPPVRVGTCDEIKIASSSYCRHPIARRPPLKDDFGGETGASEVGHVVGDGQHSHRLEAALAFAGRGWYVLPCWWAVDGRCACGDPNCSRVGKHPLGKLVHTGEKEATTDVAQITDWWKREPLANVAIATGLSGLVVFDTDPRNGGDESLSESDRRHQCTRSFTTNVCRSDTGKGRPAWLPPLLHCWSRKIQESNRTSSWYRCSCGNGIRDRRAQRWGNGDYVCVNDTDPAPVPSWLRDELLEPARSDTVQFSADGEDW